MALQTAADDRTSAALLGAGALLMAVAAVLAGCVQQREPPAAGRTAQAEPGPIQSGMGFFLSSDTGEGAKLTYGRANSDDVWLMLQCQPGARKIDIVDARHPQAKKGDLLVLTSGKLQSALPAELQPDEANGGALAVAQASPGLPALDGFRRTGDLAVKLGAREYALTATAGEKGQIARFFSLCEKH